MATTTARGTKGTVGKARLAREGEDLSAIAYGAMVTTALEATEDVDGASVEVLDMRTLYPYDRDAVLASVRKTSKVVLVQEATRSCGVAAELAALIAEEAFEDLDGPVMRVTAPDVPIGAPRVASAGALPTGSGVSRQTTGPRKRGRRNAAERRRCPPGLLSATMENGKVNG